MSGLTITEVNLITRQIVATVTAASVLLCGVICACASSMPGISRQLAVASTTSSPLDRATQPSCHGHHDVEKSLAHHDKHQVPQNGHGKKSEPCHEGDTSCSHCQSAVSVVSENGRNTTDLNPLSGLAQFTLPLMIAVPAAIANPVRCANLGDPSPPAAPTLLTLHCALNL